MKKWIPTLIAMSLFLSIACERESIINPERIWGEVSNGLRCSIEVDKHTLTTSAETSLQVSIAIQNVSGSKIEFETIPSFSLDILNNGEFWGPVDILRERPLPMNGRCDISLETGQTLMRIVDITQIGWDLSSSSIWPQKYLYDHITPGNYDLGLEIHITDQNVPEWIRSNEIEIRVVN